MIEFNKKDQFLKIKEKITGIQLLLDTSYLILNKLNRYYQIKRLPEFFINDYHEPSFVIIQDNIYVHVDLWFDINKDEGCYVNINYYVNNEGIVSQGSEPFDGVNIPDVILYALFKIK